MIFKRFYPFVIYNMATRESNFHSFWIKFILSQKNSGISESAAQVGFILESEKVYMCHERMLPYLCSVY